MAIEQNTTTACRHEFAGDALGLMVRCKKCGAPPQQTQTTVTQFKPGSFGCHEALHMASVIAEMVDERLCQHPAISARPDWLQRAETACQALHDLYQEIGREHL